MCKYLLLMGLVGSAGCGLISSDVTNFDLTLPSKMFSVDASGWNVNQTAADAYLGTSCNPSQPPPNVCSSAAQQACAMGCAGVCGSASRCELIMQVGVHQPVDLVNEKPELKTINDEPIIKVTIDSVQYEVTANTLNVATPVMKLKVAPMSVMDPNDPMAKQIGVVPAVPEGMTVTLREITFTDGSDTADAEKKGRQNLIDIMSTYKNPFNVLVGSELRIKMGDMVPTGRLDAAIHIKAHAGI